MSLTKQLYNDPDGRAGGFYSCLIGVAFMFWLGGIAKKDNAVNS